MQYAEHKKKLAYQAVANGELLRGLRLLQDLATTEEIDSELANDMAVLTYKLGDISESLKLFRQALSLPSGAERLIATNLLDILDECIKEKNKNAICELPSLSELKKYVLPDQADPNNINISDETNLICPVCRKNNIGFLPIPDFYREHALQHGFIHYGKGEMTAHETYSCSHCGASDRERLYAYWIEQQFIRKCLRQGMRVIHFAPENSLSKVIRSSNLFSYITADIMMKNVDYQVDIMDTGFPENSFDFFICSHVLEHVESDDRAIRELYRITRQGGCGILMAPIIVGLPHTLEDPLIIDAAGRWKNYGQDDHVRLYAHDDYVQKIESIGFVVDQYGIDYFGVRVFKTLGLKDTSILYVVRK